MSPNGPRGEVPGILYRSGDFYASAAAAGLRVGSRLAGLALPVPRTPGG